MSVKISLCLLPASVGKKAWLSMCQNNLRFIFSSSSSSATQTWDLFLSVREKHTHLFLSSVRHRWETSCCQTHSPHTESEGRPGRVTQVALQSAVFLSLPKVSERMAVEGQEGRRWTLSLHAAAEGWRDLKSLFRPVRGPDSGTA